MFIQIYLNTCKSLTNRFVIVFVFTSHVFIGLHRRSCRAELYCALHTVIARFRFATFMTSVSQETQRGCPWGLIIV